MADETKQSDQANGNQTAEAAAGERSKRHAALIAEAIPVIRAKKRFAEGSGTFVGKLTNEQLGEHLGEYLVKWPKTRVVSTLEWQAGELNKEHPQETLETYDVQMGDVILSDRFAAVGEVAVDERNRIALTKALESVKDLFTNPEELRFFIHVNEVGQLLLSPVVSVPLYEAWLYKNPAALAKVAHGLSQVGGPALKDLGSFEKHADDEIE